MLADIHSSLENTRANASYRRYPRALFCVPITLHHLVSGDIRTTRGISLDIGEGGLGALTEGALLVGETVAIVRHTSRVRSGFEFVGLSAEERLQVKSVIGKS